MPSGIKQWLDSAGGTLSSTIVCCLTRGLCPAPLVPSREASAFDTFHWHVRPDEPPINATIFTDGSLLDGTLGVPAAAALGWSFVALDGNDHVLAAAYGVPPRWVDTIHGAELWAVQMALQTGVFVEAVVTDCKSVQLGAGKDSAWMGSSKRRYARIWNVLSGSLEGRGSELVIWMPAHTGKQSVGSTSCSNGSVLTEAWRCANEMADLLAKDGAESVRVDEDFRAEVKEGFQRARELAIFVGKLTFEAGAHKTTDGQTRRDACPMPATREETLPKKLKQRRLEHVENPLEGTPEALFGRSDKLAATRRRILERIHKSSNPKSGSTAP